MQVENYAAKTDYRPLLSAQGTVPMFFYKITEKRQADMVKEIEARKAKSAK